MSIKTGLSLFQTKRLRIEEAEEVLGKIYGGSKEWIQYDLDEMKTSKKEEKKAKRLNGEFQDANKRGTGETATIVRVARTPHVRRAAVIGCSMQMWQQLIGINTIMLVSVDFLCGDAYTTNAAETIRRYTIFVSRALLFPKSLLPSNTCAGNKTAFGRRCLKCKKNVAFPLSVFKFTKGDGQQV